MDCGVYEIVNQATGKRYIGSAVKLRNRFCVHRKTLRDGNHHSGHLQAAWNKYGEASFVFNRLLFCSPDDSVFFEQRAIDVFTPEYNIARVAGSCLGVRHSAETRAKRSALNMGNKFSLGRKLDAESRARLSASRMGRRKGIKRLAEAVAKTAAAHRGMKRSVETRAKIAAKALGRKWSDVAKAKLSATLTGRKMSDEARKKLLGNQHAAGHKPTSDENARRSATLKAAWAAKLAAGIPWR